MAVVSFPRTQNPLVTIMLPTRGRSDLLIKSVDSLVSLSVDRSKIEFIFRADSDDPSTVDVCRQICEQLHNAQTIVGRRGFGYRDMHHWVNAMCRMARGDWIIIWNDDAVMKTERWDEVLANTNVECSHNCPDVYTFSLPDLKRSNSESSNDFLLVRRKVVEILGHFSLSPYNDTWMVYVMEGAKSKSAHPIIRVEHNSDSVIDSVRDEAGNAFSDGVYHQSIESAMAKGLIRMDTSILNRYISDYRK